MLSDQEADPIQNNDEAFFRTSIEQIWLLVMSKISGRWRRQSWRQTLLHDFFALGWGRRYLATHQGVLKRDFWF